MNTEPAPAPANLQTNRDPGPAAPVRPGTDGRSAYETLLGAGAALWETDDEFDRFLGLLRDIRHAKG